MSTIKKIKTLETIKVEDEDTKENVYHDGLCTRSPNGTLWRIKVDDAGSLSTEQVAE